MGFWDKVKSVAVSAKCMTGWHAGTYTHIDGEPLCHLGKTCPDCNEYVTKIVHKFSEWEYLDYGKCDAKRSCIHCAYEEYGVQHDYEEQGKNSDCRIIEICTRCGDEQLGRENHNWLNVAGHELKVGGKRKCKDCGKIES